MRKRRRLANKMTIMVCAVLLAVSAFFYASMEVSASSSSGSLSATVSENAYRLYAGVLSQGIGTINLYETALDNVLYEVDLNVSANVDLSRPLRLVNFVLNFNGKPLIHGFFGDGVDGQSYLNSYSYSRALTVYLKGSELKSIFVDYSYSYYAETSGSFVSDIVFDYLVKSVTPLSASDSNDYQDGYNAGYSAGEQFGYGNGYSQGFADGESSVDTNDIYNQGFADGESSVDINDIYNQGFADGESSVDTNDIYNQGFEAGKNSVDMQSYYDAGYQAGYDAAYSAGYESGYDVGYQSAMDRIDSWGADTSDYPLLVSESGETFDLQFDFIEEGSNEAVYSDYADYERYYTGIEFNPNHTYRLDFTYHNFSYEYDSFFTSSFSFWLYWGDSSFPLIVGSKDDITTSVFIPGDRISNGLRFRCDLGQIESNGSIDVLHYYLKGCYLKLYDMGPSGDTQNHIANQTDQLTNGFDESQGNSVNSDLSTGLNEYQTAEDSLWATATTGLKDFTFFDFESVPAMITGMSFITSIMGIWFNEAGGSSGVGIVLSILFSVMLVAMVLGLYRLYQSKGGKN